MLTIAGLIAAAAAYGYRQQHLTPQQKAAQLPIKLFFGFIILLIGVPYALMIGDILLFHAK